MRRIRLLPSCLPLSLVVLAGCSTTPYAPLAARVTEYGIYERGAESVYKDVSAPSGQSREYVGFRLKSTTRAVPLRLGTSFGFCYEVSGLALGARPKVIVDAEHPAFARPGQAPTKKHQFSRSTTPAGGVLRDCTGYGFDHEFELIPGEWRFTVVVDGTPVLTQFFVAE